MFHRSSPAATASSREGRAEGRPSGKVGGQIDPARDDDGDDGDPHLADRGQR